MGCEVKASTYNFRGQDISIRA